MKKLLFLGVVIVFLSISLSCAAQAAVKTPTSPITPATPPAVSQNTTPAPSAIPGSSVTPATTPSATAGTPFVPGATVAADEAFAKSVAEKIGVTLGPAELLDKSKIPQNTDTPFIYEYWRSQKTVAQGGSAVVIFRMSDAGLNFSNNYGFAVSEAENSLDYNIVQADNQNRGFFSCVLTFKDSASIGEHIVTFKLTDGVGNQNSLDIKFQVDKSDTRTPPITNLPRPDDPIVKSIADKMGISLGPIEFPDKSEIPPNLDVPLIYEYWRSQKTVAQGGSTVIIFHMGDNGNNFQVEQGFAIYDAENSLDFKLNYYNKGYFSCVLTFKPNSSIGEHIVTFKLTDTIGLSNIQKIKFQIVSASK